MAADEAPGRFDAALRRRSAGSVGWTAVRLLSDQVFAFAVFLILARLLPREAIGAFAVIAVVAEVFRIVSASGLTQTIARVTALDNAFLDTIHRANMALGIGSCLLVQLIAAPFAAFMDAPEIETPLRVLSLALPISALGATHMALRLREFGHRTMAARSLAAGVIGGGAAIAAATAGLGLWALVIQRLVTAAIGAGLARTAYRWRPGRAFDWSILRRHLGLNAGLTYIQLAFFATVRLQELVIGSVIGLVAVGVYRVAWRTVELIANGAIQPFSTVAMQTLARVRDDRAELASAYRWMISKAAALSFPMLVGFGVLAPLAVPTAFGGKWAEAGRLAEVFAFMALPFTLNFFASPSLGALGASRSLVVIATVQLALSALFTLIAAPFGLAAVAWAYVARAYLTLPLQVVLLKRASGIGPGQTLAAIGAPLIASTVMGVIVYAALRVPALAELDAWWRLALLVMLGVTVYAPLLLALSGAWRRRAARLGRQLLRRAR